MKTAAAFETGYGPENISRLRRFAIGTIKGSSKSLKKCGNLLVITVGLQILTNGRKIQPILADMIQNKFTVSAEVSDASDTVFRALQYRESHHKQYRIPAKGRPGGGLTSGLPETAAVNVESPDDCRDQSCHEEDIEHDCNRDGSLYPVPGDEQQPAQRLKPWEQCGGQVVAEIWKDPVCGNVACKGCWVNDL